ncbi:MAG: tetratricopeptide repeat protein [Myxococcales bacterium]|nr:tetratricopeptide repeat protein [Myxococcales bacterium]
MIARLAIVAALLGLPLGALAQGKAPAPAGGQAGGGAVQQALAAKDYARALKLLEAKARREGHKNAATLKQLGQVASWAKQNDAAIKWYRAYMKLRPGDDTTHLGLAQLLSWSKRRADQLEALKIYDHHIAWRPNDVGLRLRRARVRYWAGQRAGAVADYEAYLKARPNDVSAKGALGQLLVEEAALASVKRGVMLIGAYLAQNPKDVAARLRRGRALMRLGEGQQAIEDFRAYLAKHPGDSKVRDEMARALATLKDKKSLALSLALYNKRLASNPRDLQSLLSRCRVYTLMGRTKEAIEDCRRYVSESGRTKKAQLDAATVLSWSRERASLDMSVRLFDIHLRLHPGDLAVQLKRARVLSWARRYDESVAAYRAYLRARPKDPKALLEMAAVLGWQASKAKREHAALLYKRYLLDNPQDCQTRVKLGRLRYWMGQYKRAVAEFRRCLSSNPGDDELRELLAHVLAESGDLRAAKDQLEKLSKDKRDKPSAQLIFAKVMRMQGEMTRAETALDRLAHRVDAKKQPKLARMVRLERAQLYAASGRKMRAIAIAEQVVGENPKDADAMLVLRNVKNAASEPRVVPSFFAYRDTQGNLLVKAGLVAEAYLHPRMSLYADVSAWRISHVREGLWTQRFDFGLRLRPTNNAEIRAALGPRTYQIYDAELGANVDVTLRPTAWLRLGAAYSYDDLYQVFYQPGSLSARARGHSASASAQLTLPYRIVASGEATLRFLDPSNRAVDVSGSVVVPIWSLLSVGYYGRWLGWTKTDPSYWSPTAFNMHMALARVLKELPRLGLALQGQVALGLGAERIDGVAETGVQPALSARVDASYSPTRWLTIAASVDMGYWPRLQIVDFEGGVGSPDVQQTRIKNADTFFWIAPTLTATFRL